MPNFHALKLLDAVVGIDMHTLISPPLPLWIHPYFGPIFLWHTPKFPKADVFINGIPACAVGAMGYFFHIPQGVPVVIPCQPYWLKWLLNIAMGLTLMSLTIIANQVISAISALIPKPKVVDDFINEVTGDVMLDGGRKFALDSATAVTESEGVKPEVNPSEPTETDADPSVWQKIGAGFSVFTQWQTWVQLLIPPIPYPGAQGSTIVGNPKVTVNGGPIGIVAPLTAMSCSEIPIVPNAIPIGFSNVYVGMSWGDLLKGIAVATVQSAISEGIGAGVSKITDKLPGMKSCGCQ